ncbi:phosphotransferase [Streptomyces sp. NPDC053542]|uniref:phosphotransferase n=1 Tax=Streptomyces sp. NPDC053542 TaxID=3365710 RepID=UPI0037CD2C73
MAFADPRLRAGEVEQDRLGMPRTASGRNAVVFRLTGPGGPWAVRCMTRAPAEGARRYNALVRHVRSSPCPVLTAAEWVDPGILVRGAWWPVVLMPWIPGGTLDTAVADRLDEPRALRHMAANWRVVLAQLRRSGVGHGDLQHGNVLVDEDLRLRLVDLDSVWVPGTGQWPRSEAGHPDYQHPHQRRSAEAFQLDAFPASVIFLSMLAVAADPALWELHTQENLIFRAPDFRQPGRTNLWKRLAVSPDSRVAALARHLANDCAQATDPGRGPEELLAVSS